MVSFLLLALRGAFEVWDIVRRLVGFGYSTWTHRVGLALDCASTGVLIVLALAVVEALRDQPGSQGG